ncbi:stage VI sporulation protein F [Gracilibacillus alcaliphilus]|uniref:stage VI sporulation protein F n=1 Tax=Gracilibacillus alcaliphilus TaxID=1401441 RepID=UPI001956366B|nr:stage VI sporulation protein F [Gracilibacillus alcaliphilus]MBM7675178.1 MFS superfamily sulfate permease-like transporter [Gracilibacillus alcaliphilus]
MSDLKKNMFDQIQKKSNIQPDQIMKVAQSVQNADFSDEQTVRRLVKQLAQVAGKNVSKQKEDKIVKAITNNNMPGDIKSLNKLFKN